MPTKRLEYLHPELPPRSTVEERLRSDDAAEVQRTLVAVALNESDLDWAYSRIIRGTEASDPGVRATSILCLGHLARIHRRLPDRRVIAIVRAGLTDADEEV